jgi:outer membrane protein assembly factor BamB
MTRLPKPGWQITLLLFLFVPVMQGATWPGFRGPNGSGVSEARDLPVEFGPKKNLLWKVAIPRGVSSPVLVQDRVLLTAADGKRRLVICLDSGTGKQLWVRSIEVTHPHHRHPLNDPASPTPVTDGSSVYAFFPEYGLVAYDLSGTEKWRVALGPFVSLHGISASPVLSGDKIVLLIDQARGSFIAAFRRKDGHQEWKTERPDAGGGYSTPVVSSAPGGGSQVVVSSPRELVG